MSYADVAARFRFAYFTFLLLISVLFPLVSSAAAEDLCSLPRIASEGIDRFETSECFAVDLRSAGVFSLAAEPFSSSGEDPVLTYLGFSSCRGEAGLADASRLLSRTVASLALEANSPGVFGFCLGVESGDGAPVDLRVVRRFAPWAGQPAGAEKDEDPDEAEPDPKPFTGCESSDWNKDEDPDEAEPDPKPFTSCDDVSWTKDEDPDEAEPDPKPFLGCGASDWNKDEDPDEAEPDPKPFTSCDDVSWAKDEDPDEAEPDPKPFTGCGGLCAERAWADDHADLVTCASALGALAEACGVRHVEAELQNLAGWDHDFFVFEIKSPSRLKILARSEVGLELVLLDSAGQRLEASGATGSRGAPTLEAALPGGRYFLRVASADGGEGPYSLRIETIAIDP